MEENRPARGEVKVTWRLAWALWWRWLLLNLALAAAICAVLVVLVFAFGLRY